MRRLVAQMIAVPVAASLVLAAGCQRREDVEGFCGSGSVAPARNAVSIAPPGAAPREARIAALGSAGFAVVWVEGEDAAQTDLFARAVSAGAVLAGPERRLTQVAGRSDRPRVAVGSTSLGVVWRDDRFGRKEALGTTVGFDLASTGAVSAFRAPQFDDTQSPEPAIASVGTGFLVVWNGRGADLEDHLYAGFLGAEGATPVVPTGLDEASPPSVAYENGLLAVVDAEERAGLASPPDVFAYVVGTAGGLRETRVGQPGRALAPEVAVAGGVAGITWCDDRNGPLELWFAALDAAGVRQSDRRISPGSIGGVCEHAIASADGSFFVTWNEYAGGERTVRFRTLRPDGSADGPFWDLGRDSEPANEDEPLARPSVAWNGNTAGVVWRTTTTGDAPQLFFRPLTCIAGPSATPTP